MLTSSFKSPLRIALLASAIGFGFSATASAQDYDRYGTPVSYSDNGPEEFVITAPRHRPERSTIGAPIENVSLSEAVRYDDLDLTTDRGIHRLHERISATARALCRRLDVTHPIATADSPPCYRTAMEEAAPLAIAAIDRVNGAHGAYDGRRYYNDEDRRYDDGDDY